MPQSCSLELHTDTSAGTGHDVMATGALSDSPILNRLPFGVSPLASVGLRGFQGLDGFSSTSQQTANMPVSRR